MSALKKGIYLAFFYHSTFFLILCPLRVYEWSKTSARNHGVLTYLAMALGRDLLSLLPFVVAYVGIMSGFFLFFKNVEARKVLMQPFLSLLTMSYALAVFFFGFFFIQFRVEQGFYPTLHDFMNGSGGVAIALSYAKVFLNPYLWVPISLSMGLILLLRMMLRRKLGSFFVSSAQQWVGFFLGTLILIVPLFQIWAYSAFMSRSHVDNIFKNFEAPIGRDGTQFYNGFKTIFSSADIDLTNFSRGFAYLGLDFKDEGSCSYHPLRVPLIENINGRLQPSVEQLSFLLGDTSRLIFQYQKKPILITHMLLESIRSLEVAAVNPVAAKTVMPFINGMYENAASDKPTSIAVKNVFQSGIRSSHGISASMCGMGALPMNFSLTREFSYLDFRCLPDVLRDSGFRLENIYGGHMKFDNMEHFFYQHGFKNWSLENIDHASYRPKTESSLGMMTDLETLEFYLDQLSRAKGGRSLFTNILTQSSHSPFNVPYDYPEDVLQDISEWINRSLPDISREHQDYLKVVRYTDHFVESLDVSVNAEMGAAYFPILIGYGDHSISGVESFPNQEHGEKVPFFIKFSRRIKTLPNYSEIKSNLSQINKIFNSIAISQNDIPRIILALLSGANEIRSMPLDKSWHTIGGQVFSDKYTSPYEGRRDVIWGIDRTGKFFVGNLRGEVIFREETLKFAHSSDLNRESRIAPILSAIRKYQDQSHLFCQ